MIIKLTWQREDLILSLLQSGKFNTIDEVVDEALRLVVERHQAAGSQPDESHRRTGWQLENLRRLGRKLDAMPPGTLSTGGTEDVADGLCGLARTRPDRIRAHYANRDHDRILYGK